MPVVPLEAGVLPVSPSSSLGLPSNAPAIDPKESGIDFGKLLETTLERVNEAHQTAQSAAEAFAAGELDDIHGTMIALSKSEIELRMVTSVRDRVVDAFYEIWRMNI